MFKLYTLSGSSHSARAQKYLSDSDVEFEYIEFSEPHQLAALYLDLGISELPALIWGAKRAEGLEKIRMLVSEANNR